MEQLIATFLTILLPILIGFAMHLISGQLQQRFIRKD